MVNWHISFLSDRKQRLVYNGTVCDWMMTSKGTTQGSVSRPHLFNLFLDDDLETDSNLDDVSMVKYANSDSTILVTVIESLDNSERAQFAQFMVWTNNNKMKCNTAKCKGLVITKKCDNSIYPEMFNIKQYDRVTLLQSWTNLVPRAFPLKKGWGFSRAPHPFFKVKALGTRLNL